MKRIGAVLATSWMAFACGAIASDPSNGVNGDPNAGPNAGVDGGTGASSIADIRADSNRDGRISFDEADADKTTWDKTHGAIFLANIDDDLEQCKAAKTDVDLPNCNDALNDVVDGPDDLLDLAPIATRPWAEAPDGTTATLSIASGSADMIRLFKRTGPEPTDFTVLDTSVPFTAEEVRAGVELAIEAKDIVRDTDVWDGYVTLEWSITSPTKSASDTVKLRVAPVMTYHHLLPAQEAFVSNTGDSANAAMRKDLATGCKAASLDTPVEVDSYDPWTQDFFETAYTSMPGPNGEQHVMHVNYRSANLYQPQSKKSPLRQAGRYVFTDLRGKDSAGVQQFDPKHNLNMDSLNSFGNFETIPPYTLNGESFPLGRVLRGKTKTFFPDPTFTKMIESQGIQPPVYIDTSWLLVGHVDETISFVKVDSPRGWAVLVNDARLAKQMLEAQVEAGHGDVPMFVGKNWYDDRGNASPAQATIQQVLADTDVMDASAKAAVEVDGQLAALREATGLTDAEILRVPYLHHDYDSLSVAYQPGTVNGFYAGDKDFVAPDPHGPTIDGKDIFRQDLTDTLAKVGITAHFAEDWDEYHAQLGEVHCGSNTRRAVPDVKWWETGR